MVIFSFLFGSMAASGEPAPAVPPLDRFAAQFNAGEISGLPPYFPSDRTLILCRVEFPQA
jgi:hypothetical protein